jgi:hypothetical protein
MSKYHDISELVALSATLAHTAITGESLFLWAAIAACIVYEIIEKRRMTVANITSE